MVLVVPGGSALDSTVRAFAVAPDAGDRTRRADGAAALRLAVTAVAADGVRRRRRGRCTAVGKSNN